MQLSFPTKMKLGYNLQQVTCETKGSSIMKLFSNKNEAWVHLTTCGGGGRNNVWSIHDIYIYILTR